MKFYIDGDLAKESPSTAGAMTVIPGPVTIGGQSPQILDAFIDEVIFFNTVLEEEDISNIMARGLALAIAVSVAEKLASTWGQLKSE